MRSSRGIINISKNIGSRIEHFLESILFTSRWLLAPMYLGLASFLMLLLITFAKKLWHILSNIGTLSETEVILGALSLIDLSLAANLVVIVVFSGYENFVSKMDLNDHDDNPDWKKNVDFAALKLKLAASIIAISIIHLLQVFMDIEDYSDREITWAVTIHVIFLLSAICLALMDYMKSQSKSQSAQPE